ncbi:MAG TPA: hypothetical protein VHF91_04550, partial [Acidimicrobiales bacterium]|nr:hypothetical protein [Acidimicrobiales bacterium]
MRIIGAEEAAAAIEAGQVSPRVPVDAPRFGDVPQPPPGPQPPLRFPGSDPAAVAKPPVVIPDPPPTPPTPPAPPPSAAPAASDVPPPPAEPPQSSWAAAFESRSSAGDDPSAFWDPPVVATAPPGRFEELVAAAAKAEAEARAAEAAAGGDAAAGNESLATGSVSSGPPSAELREITPDHPLTSDPVSGEWAVASGLGGNVGPSVPAGGGSRPGRSLPGPGSGAPPPPSDWDRLTGTASGRRQVGDQRSWEFSGEGGEGRDEPASPPPSSEDPPTMSLPHWTEPPSGEVPRILGDSKSTSASGSSDDELSAWSALSTGPRWRDQPADWDEADFSDTVLDDREARLGALRDQPEDEDGDIFAFDEVVAPTPPPQASARTRGTATQVRPARRGREAVPGGGP